MMPTTERIDRDGDVKMQDSTLSKPRTTIESKYTREDSGYADATTASAAPTGRYVTDYGS
jgi:hypothetical protein